MAKTRGSRFDRSALLGRLEPINYEADDDDHPFENASLARVLLNLAGVNQEGEYTLCQQVARHLLGRVPEPDDLEV